MPLVVTPTDYPRELLFSLAGAGCLLRTNSASLVASIDRNSQTAVPVIACELHVNVVTDNFSPLATPHFRGMHHVVVASFGAANVFVFDLIRNIITATISAPTAEDSDFWDRTLLPIAAGVCGASIGLLPVHAACLSRDGDGLLIAGESGAGKSTLSVAHAQRGFDFISDDWTYCSRSSQRLSANGTGARVKLLPDAADHFPLLHPQPLVVSMNGEVAFEVAADRIFGATVKRQCRPRMLLFLERSGCVPTRSTRLSQRDACQYLANNVERLPAELIEVSTVRTTLIHAVASLPCWRLECGGSPSSIARDVELLYARQRRRWTL